MGEKRKKLRNRMKRLEFEEVAETGEVVGETDDVSI